jgi:predicted acetyltransferase
MTTASPALTVGTIGPEGLEPVLRAVEAAFGEDATPQAIASWSRILERERTYAVRDGTAVVGGGSVYTFGLSIPGGSLPAGGLTAVGVLPSHRRRGALRALMRQVIDDGIARGEPIGVLWASEGAIYGRYGYGLAALRCTVTAPRHQIAFRPPVPEHGRIRLVDAAEALRLLPPVWERFAQETPGLFRRSEGWWEHEVLDDAEWRRGGAGPRFIPVLEVDGRVEGYAFYRMRPEWDHLGPRNVLEVRELIAPDPAAELALWRFVFEMDLVATIKALNVPVDTPLFLRTQEPRRLGMTMGDGLWLRLLDLPSALGARAWAADGGVVVEVQDDLVRAVAGRWRFEASGGRGGAERTSAPAELHLGVAELSSLFLGGTRAVDLVRAGRLTAADTTAPGRLDAMLAVSRRPWCPAIF